MAGSAEIETMKYYTIQRVEGQEEIVVTGKVGNGIHVLIHSFAKDEEDKARNLVDAIAKSPNYVWDMQGETKIQRNYIKEIIKEKKTGKPIPFYYAVLFDGEQIPLATAQG